MKVKVEVGEQKLTRALAACEILQGHFESSQGKVWLVYQEKL